VSAFAQAVVYVDHFERPQVCRDAEMARSLS